MAIQDPQDLTAFQVQRGSQVCLGLVHLDLLDFLVSLVHLGLRAQVHRGLLDQGGSRDSKDFLVHQG